LPLRGLTSLDKEPVHPLIILRRERDQRLNPISCGSCVYSVVLMGRETGTLQLLTSLLLTEGNEADLVIRGNIVLNMKDSTKLNARSRRRPWPMGLGRFQ
jgi:hypothetical protein